MQTLVNNSMNNSIENPKTSLVLRVSSAVPLPLPRRKRSLDKFETQENEGFNYHRIAAFIFGQTIRNYQTTTKYTSIT